MSALGHLRTSPLHFRKSAIPPKADIIEHRCHVRLVPQADIQQELFDDLVGAGKY